MTPTTITETCSCSAKITISGDPVHARGEADRWRKNHRHDTTPSTPDEPEAQAVTGTFHQAGHPRTGIPTGRRTVGFQLKES